MYEQLVKDLREDAEWAEANQWETPICLSDHLKQAADAIEDLLDTVEAQKAEIITLTGQQDEPCEACKIGGNADGTG